MRQSHRLATLCAFCLWVWCCNCTAGITLAPSIDFQTQGNSSAATAGQSNGTSLNFRYVNSPRSEYRFGMEFPTASIPFGSVITGVTWRGTPASVNMPGSVLEFHGYAGNGLFALTDTYNPTNLVGQLDGVTTGDERSVEIDPGYYSSLLGTGSHFGLYARERTNNVSGTFFGRNTATPPQLDVALIDPAAGTSNRWTSTSSASWSDAGSWSQGVPTATQDVFLRPTNPSVMLAPTGHTEVNSLTVGGAGSAVVELGIQPGPNFLSHGLTTVGDGGVLKLTGTLRTRGINTAAGGTINWASDGVLVVDGGYLSTPIGDFTVDGAGTPILAMLGAKMHKINTTDTAADRMIVADNSGGFLYVGLQSDVRSRIVRVGHQTTGQGTVQVADSGTLFSPVALFEVGPVGNGVVSIEQQARMEAGLVFVGATLQGAIDNDDVDRLTISDPGTTAKVGSIDASGRSIVEIRNGAVVEAGGIGGAGDPLAPPLFRVTGAGTRLTVSDRIQTGSTQTTNAASRMLIEDGARVDTKFLILGIGSGTTGISRSTMTVSGAGSQVNTTDMVLLGGLRDSESSLEVLHGGVLRAGKFAGIGYSTAAVPANTVAAVRISGTGSRWEQTDEISVGGVRDLNGNLADLGTATLTVEDGGTLTATTAVNVMLRGTVHFSGGRIEAPLVTNNRGGAFHFSGGRLAIGQFDGNLVQQGGTLASGTAPGKMEINGNYTLGAAGTLEVELAANANPGLGYDQYVISGDATLGGKVNVTLLNGFTPTLGDSFQFLTAAGTLNNMFDEFLLPQLASGLGWRLTQTTHALSLDVVASLDGDFNHDSVVDAADYTVWRDGLGSAYTSADYAIWKSHFGQRTNGGAATASLSVPEADVLALTMLAFTFTAPALRRRVRIARSS